jgi:NADH dehydrogenase
MPTRDDTGSLSTTKADVRDEGSVSAALHGADSVVNAVSLYVEKGAETFDSVHVHGAQMVARCAARCGVERLVHVSGIGVSAASASSYVRARAAGERAVKEQFPDVAIVRPSVLFGPGGGFLGAVDDISRVSPVFPLFGVGDTRLQPVYVDDVAEAVARLLADATKCASVSELGGPRVLTYRDIIHAVLDYRRRRRLLVPVPFFVWSFLAKLVSRMANPPLTQDQVVLMRDDNVVGTDVVTFEDLHITPRDLGTLLSRCLDGDAIS